MNNKRSVSAATSRLPMVWCTRFGCAAGRILAVATCWALAGTAGAAGKTTAAGSAAQTPPAELRTVIGKDVWFAPHAGCADRVSMRRTGSTPSAPPSDAVPLHVTEAVRSNGQWLLRFDSRSGAGETRADRVIEDLRFDPLPSTYYSTCFFLDEPAAIHGFLRARMPLEFQRYDRGAP